MKKITSIALLALAASTAHGKTIIRFDCQFPFYSDEDGAKKTQKEIMSPTYILTQEEDGSLSAIFSGNAGATDLLVSPGAGTYNLLEFTNGGIVNVTTLQPNETLTSAKAVHSRHVALPMLDMWMPSQWYGDCRILR